MKTVWKYQVLLTEEQSISLPRGAEITQVGVHRNGLPYIWAVVDPRAQPEIRNFVMHATGAKIPDHADYVGSINASGYRFHLLELKK